MHRAQKPPACQSTKIWIHKLLDWKLISPQHHIFSIFLNYTQTTTEAWQLSTRIMSEILFSGTLWSQNPKERVVLQDIPWRCKHLGANVIRLVETVVRCDLQFLKDNFVNSSEMTLFNFVTDHEVVWFWQTSRLEKQKVWWNVLTERITYTKYYH